ncbi:MAG: Jag N-terminal domain-containing protein [Elusimicrobiota bacterium]
MREIKVEAKTVKEAIEKGLSKLQLRREQVEVEVINEEKKGILGFGSKNACVILREKIWRDEKEIKKQESTKELNIDINSVKNFQPTGNILEDVKNLLNDIFTLSKIEFKILDESYDKESNTVYINFQSPDAGLLLYDNAKGLLSLSQTISVILNKNPEKKITIKLDTEEFWAKAENRIKRDIEHAIEFINRTKKPYKMKPMAPPFRKIIHKIVKEKYPDYTTFSMGYGKIRRVVIKPVPKRKQENEQKQENSSNSSIQAPNQNV